MHIGGRFHAVRFYRDSRSLCEVVGKFFAEGFLAGQPAVVIATPEHRTQLGGCLHDRGFDAEALERDGKWIVRDASDALDAFMVDGLPDPVRFYSTIQPLLAAAAGGRSGVTVRAYGEMVNVLWQSGLTDAATRLEVLWNDLARTEQFSLLCGYSMGNFYKEVDVETICGHHTHILTEEVPRETPLH